MKKLSLRAIIVLILVAALLAGLTLYLVRYTLYAERWMAFPGNPHAYSGTELAAGTVTDRGGETLLTLGEDKTYAESAAVRRATLHLLGDRSGNVASPALKRYAARLIGYDPVFGMYGAEKRVGTMELTVSADVQTTALQALDGRPGTVLVCNYRTGAILCAVSSPTFDPDGAAPEETDAVYLNRAFGAVYTPGSIFKLVTAAAALEQLPDAETRLWHCDGTCEIGGETVVCNGVHGDVTLKEALARSCNCAFAGIAQELDRESFAQSVASWNVTAPCEFDGVVTAEGRFDVADASDVDFAWACIGQHTDLVDPCAYLRFVATLAGGGTAAEPYLVERVGSYRAHPKQTEPTVQPETAATLAEYMRYAAETVYGDIAGLPVCAKSGTAEVAEGEAANANFVGFVQSEEYPLAFCITVEGGGSGSKTCAPIADTVLRACVAAMED
ncbi:MAG: penicillin-binding protein [Oscillospiraceae bacterium]|nr:penicillin-binding protein [Oscillospiraceae bacterium]